MKKLKSSLLLGLIGHPVGHTLSPVMHNAALKSLGIDGAYSAFDVPPSGLKPFIRSLTEFGVRGFNVTIPHKERIIPCLDRLDKEAELIGAVNTVVVRNGKLAGYNTDGRGFIASLEEDLGVQPKGKRFFMFGAGGAARAIAFSLALRKAKRIVILDVDRKKSASLARAVAGKTKCEAVALRRSGTVMRELLLNTEVLINATPCGMKRADPSVVDKTLLHKGLAVYDVIYNPPATSLIRNAVRRGIPAANGLGMLINQGAQSFSLWTGKKPPVDVMRKALKKYLA